MFVESTWQSFSTTSLASYNYYNGNDYRKEKQLIQERYQ
jgi:hypothetical protein